MGVLATNGTIASSVYPDIMQKYEIDVIQPPAEIQSVFVHPAIYDHEYGIKAYSNPVKKIAVNNLKAAATYLSRKGAQAIILGCTEIPLALTQKKVENSIVIDATTVLAAALIRESRREDSSRILKKK